MVKKRIFSIILLISMAATLAGPADAGYFKDVPKGHWASGYIDEAAARGYVNGIGDGRYDPAGRVSFAEFAAMTARLLFPDELRAWSGSRECWYTLYVGVCFAENVFMGADFALGRDETREMTRAEVALMSANALRSAGAVMPDLEELEAVEARIPDLALNSPDEIAAIRWVYVKGVMNGCDNGLFEGSGTLNRAQVAAVLMRMSRVELKKPSDGLDEGKIFDSIMAMRERYPEGTRWTNENSYAWRGGIFNVGYGCAGFAFLLSDAAFGDLPARRVTGVRLEDVRVGDILRINSDTHSVVVLKVNADSVTVAEGNYNSSVHWGRELSRSQVESASYVLTRWPE